MITKVGTHLAVLLLLSWRSADGRQGVPTTTVFAPRKETAPGGDVGLHGQYSPNCIEGGAILQYCVYELPTPNEKLYETIGV